MKSIIYGPVPSWRLGRSLGVDLLSTEGKTCSFDCIYCQLGKTIYPLMERREFVTIAQLVEQLEGAKSIAADYLTFSGVGEPTLASNLGPAIKIAKSILSIPVAVLTNSSFMTREDVRDDLAKADTVVAKLDAPNESLFHQINRPVAGYSLERIIRAIRLFREKYKGKLAIQMMFIKANMRFVKEMAAIAKQLSPDEVQINTPLRPCAVEPLTPEEIAALRDEFIGCRRVITVYEASRPEVTPLNLEQTLQRRPKL